LFGELTRVATATGASATAIVAIAAVGGSVAMVFGEVRAYDGAPAKPGRLSAPGGGFGAPYLLYPPASSLQTRRTRPRVANYGSYGLGCRRSLHASKKEEKMTTGTTTGVVGAERRSEGGGKNTCNEVS